MTKTLKLQSVPQLHYKPCQRSVCAYMCVPQPTFRKVLPNTDPCKVISPPQMSLLCVLMATSQTLSSSLPRLPTTHTNTHMLRRHKRTNRIQPGCHSVGGPEEPRHQSINSDRFDGVEPIVRSYINRLYLVVGLFSSTVANDLVCCTDPTFASKPCTETI